MGKTGGEEHEGRGASCCVMCGYMLRGVSGWHGIMSNLIIPPRLPVSCWASA